MFIADHRRAGHFPLRDHTDPAEQDPERRAMVVGVQIQGREPDGRYNPAGGARASSVAARTGDVQSALFLEPESRKIGSWFFAAPAVLSRPSKRRKVKKTSGGTRTRAQQD